MMRTFIEPRMKIQNFAIFGSLTSLWSRISRTVCPAPEIIIWFVRDFLLIIIIFDDFVALFRTLRTLNQNVAMLQCCNVAMFGIMSYSVQQSLQVSCTCFILNVPNVYIFKCLKISLIKLCFVYLHFPLVIGVTAVLKSSIIFIL